MGGQIFLGLSATSCHMLDKVLVMPSSGKLRVEDLEGKKYFIVQFPFRGHVVPQKPLSLGTFPSMTGKSGMGGSGADVCVGQPHGAVDGKSVLLPASPMASTVSNTFSWRGKLSLMMPSSCKQTLLHDVEKLPAGVSLAAPNRYIHWDSSNDLVESPI